MKKIRKYKENYILKPNKSGSIWFELLFLKIDGIVWNRIDATLNLAC